MAISCPICHSGAGEDFDVIGGHAFFSCDDCGSLFIDPEVIRRMDEGVSPVQYAGDYWKMERNATLDRAEADGPCRAGESILYCRRPVETFLDIGSGAGYLLRKLQQEMDPDRCIFHGVEKFPPAFAESLPNFHFGDINSLTGSYDAGVCVEVVEHLTPTMLDGLAAGLAKVSNPGGFWLFNTGLPDYVRNEERGYLDPLVRGHIISYSVKGAARIFEPHGFRVGALPGKSFAFYAERLPADDIDFETRIYHPLEQNLSLLKRWRMLYCAAFEAARSYLYQQQVEDRTQWALSLDRELSELKAAQGA